MRICFDTNIILDIFARADQFPESIFAYDIASIKRFECFISASTVSDVAYLLHRLGKTKAQTKKTMKTLFEMFSIFDTNEHDCYRALESDIPDYEDALLSASSQRHSVDLIVTRDKRDFKNSEVPVLDPRKFVEQFRPPNYKYAVL